MFPCPKCSQPNLDTAQFCTRCHQTLLYRCPKCWHEQHASGKCEKCGEDLALYWTRQLALARADLVKDRAENDPAFQSSGPPASLDDVKQFAQTIPLEPVPLLKFVAIFFARLASWIGIPH
jgi:hypothetical protein